MPWTVKDVDNHKKGLTSAQKKKWVKIANGIYNECTADGGSDKSCAAKAIRIANSKFEEDTVEPKLKKMPRGALRLVDIGCHAAAHFAEEDTDGKKPKLKMRVYSGKIIEGHWYWGRLAIDLSGIKFDRRRYPILEGHDTSKKIGFSAKPDVSQESGVELNPETTQFVDTEESSEFIKLSKQGFPYQSSLYAIPNAVEWLNKDAETEVNGFTMKGPGAVWRQCLFQESSVCVFGWDKKTQASAFSKEEVELPVEEIKLNHGEKEMTRERKEVSELKLEELMEKYPELVKQLQDTAVAKVTEKFNEEKSEFEAKLAAKDEKLSTQEERILNLEKNETIRTENEMKLTANSIWKDKLAESDIPDHLFGKVQSQVAYSRFVKDGKFDTEAFEKAVEEEIKDWEEKGITSTVIGSGFSTKDVVEEKDKKVKDQKKADDEMASDLLDLAGEPQDKT